MLGRLAPSPTGALHLGHARTFLAAWWSARSQGGSVLLRLEDLDENRCRPEHRELILRDLTWLGLDWDGPIRIQSERRARLVEHAHELERLGLAYPCVCSRRDLREAVSAPHAGSGEPVYPGTCRGRFSSLERAEAESGQSAALRFAVPSGEHVVRDRIFGEHRFTLTTSGGDFPILRRDKTPAYQLAVVVDDHDDGVTEVVRGADLLESTARQELIYAAFGWTPPIWAHVPLVTDSVGIRLAKRTHALSLAHLRELGVHPDCIVGWAARSLGLTEVERASASELVTCFAFDRIPPHPSTLEPAELSRWAGTFHEKSKGID